MSRWSRLIPALVGIVFLAACGGTSTDTPFAPATPRFDGGGVLVGGNAVDSTTNSPTNETDVPSDSTSRGGGVLVGGN